MCTPEYMIYVCVACVLQLFYYGYAFSISLLVMFNVDALAKYVFGFWHSDVCIHAAGLSSTSNNMFLYWPGTCQLTVFYALQGRHN